MFRVRNMLDTDLEAVADLTARVLGDGDGEEIRALTREAYRNCPFMRPELCWLAEEDGRIVLKGQLLDLEVRVAGVPVRVGGLQGVVAEPAYRGRGYPLRVYAQALPQALAHGFDLFLGFAQRGALYQRHGGGASVMPEYELGLDAARVPPLGEDRFWPMGEGELDALLEHYARANEGRSGSLVRSASLWPWLVRRPPRVWLHPEGYLGWREAEDAIEVRELGGTSEAFYEEALRKLAALARERGLRRVRGHVPPDDPLVGRAARYGCEVRVEYQRRAGCLARIARLRPLMQKLAPALEARLAASRLAGSRVRLALSCDGEDWAANLGGDWAANLGGGQAANQDANPGPAGAEQRKLDLALPAAALTQLLFGYLPARQLLFEHGVAADANALELLDVLFPSGWPFMWHGDRF